jgi:very-long-chain (3R)-3-hydroxyacyl-CoA dehydratase
LRGNHVRVDLFRTASLYDEVEDGLKVVQTAAILEIIHAALGLVKSPVMTTVLQVFSRVWIVWAVLHVAPPAQRCIFATLCITSWSLVEVPRYLFYAVKEITNVPYPLLWLRYRFARPVLCNIVLISTLQLVRHFVPVWYYW